MQEIPSPIRLAVRPTPLQHLPRLSANLGDVELWVKREDLTGLAFGGNKTRKLEYLLAKALSDGARTLITRGSAQSNHCRQTAAAAARCGLDCTLVLAGHPPQSAQGNILVDRLLGARIVWARDDDPEEALQREFQRLQERGERPFLIPYGGSNPLGVFAYAQAMREILQQKADFQRIVLASSSGGTQAGLELGARIHDFEGHITGISVDPPAPQLRARIAALAQETAHLLKEPLQIKEGEIDVRDDYLGGGYAVVGELEREAIYTFARTEGLLLDPVYTGRAAGGLLDLIRRGEIEPGERVLFLHTGGTPAIFAFSAELGIVDQ